MSTPSIGTTGSTGSSPISFSGLASGLNTSAIISALMTAERQPVTRMVGEQEKLQAEQQQLQGLQSSLQALSFAAAEFSLPSLFESAQSVTSSEPSRVSAATTSGAGVGGYEVEVKQLADAAQRTFTFKAPAAEDTITIDGHEYKLAAGASAKELASKVNSDSKATVYAAVLDSETIVFSSRTTGATEGEFIKVTDPGGALTEKAGTAKAGKNAEYTVDGVAGTATSNTVTTAIPGVTLTLSGLTTTGPVTIDVQAPGPSTSAIEAQVQAFVKAYNSTVEAIQKQLTTKPVANPQNATEAAVGRLFGDQELSSLLSRMRVSMYEPIKGLPAEMASPEDIGLSTGATGTEQSAVEGLLKLNPEKLASAVKANPAEAQKMLQSWAGNLQTMINGASEPGGTLEARISGDTSQVSELKIRIDAMNEILAVRQKSLEATYAELEGVISQNTAKISWLTNQSEQLNKSGL